MTFIASLKATTDNTMYFLEWKEKGTKGRITQNLPSSSIAWSEWFLNLRVCCSILLLCQLKESSPPPPPESDYTHEIKHFVQRQCNHAHWTVPFPSWARGKALFFCPFGSWDWSRPMKYELESWSLLLGKGEVRNVASFLSPPLSICLAQDLKDSKMVEQPAGKSLNHWGTRWGRAEHRKQIVIERTVVLVNHGDFSFTCY